MHEVEETTGRGQAGARTQDGGICKGGEGNQVGYHNLMMLKAKLEHCLSLPTDAIFMQGLIFQFIKK